MYIEKYHKPDMFYKSELDLINSQSEVLIQLSDFIAGTLGKIYDAECSIELKDAYDSFISNKALDIADWPIRNRHYFSDDKTSDEYSQLIYSYSLTQAKIFVEKNESAFEEEVKLQVATIKHLIFNSRFIDKNSSLGTNKIINHLNEIGFKKVSEHIFRSKVIGPLRDSDVVISSSNKGYKIPCCFSDMKEFVELVDSIVEPLIARLGRARTNLKIASLGEVDILKGPNYPHLVDFIETLEKYQKAKPKLIEESN